MSEDIYSADSSKYKPLIHTWRTLGVEWQFYMVFPFIVLFVKRNFENNLDKVFCVLFTISLVYSLYLLIQLYSAYAFYSTPSRVWELFAGSIVYLRSRNISKDGFNHYLSVLGIFILIFSIIFFKDIDSIPGFPSLLVVISTSLFILFIKQDSLIYKMMSYKYFVFIGVISYSLYLYHQPVLAFYRIGVSEVNIISFISLFIVSLCFAMCSYYCFESPIRRSNNNLKYIVVFFLLVLVILFINGALNTQGYLKRQPEHIRHALMYFEGKEYKALLDSDGQTCNMRHPKKACFFDKNTKELIAIGDSFVGVFTRILSEQNISLRVFQYEQCPLITEPIWFGDASQNCWEINKERWLVLGEMPPSNVLVGTDFEWFNRAKRSKDNLKEGERNSATKLSRKIVLQSFKQGIERLIEMGHHPIILLQTPYPQQNVELEMHKKVFKGTLEFKNEFNAISRQDIDKEIIQLLDGLDVDFIDLNSKMCISKISA